MRQIIIIITISFAFLNLSYKGEAKAEDVARCEKYRSKYLKADEKRISEMGEGIFDNNELRKNRRQLRILTTRIEQLIILEKMKANKCEIR